MRQATLFNGDWKFYKGDAPDAHLATFDDHEWRNVELPHDWSIEGPFDQNWASATGFLPGGTGWYRKTFATPALGTETVDDANRVFVHFDGVYCNSDVYINGHHLGNRPNGFIGFRYDITPYLNPAGDNVIAVRSDHSQFADARWYTGSGIYRNVTMIVTDSVHIKQWGVFASMDTVTSEKADVLLEVALENNGSSHGNVGVVCALLDSQGNTVACANMEASLNPGQERTLCGRLSVLQPRLWSPESPALYCLRTEVTRDGSVIDREETPVGLREIRFDPREGFFLNGQSMKFKGVCVHDDAGALGTAVPAKVWERRLRTLKAAGVNAIRMAHNPHMPELYDLCDRLGLMVQDEAFDEWELGKNKWVAGWNAGVPSRDGYHPHFAQWAERDLRDMVLSNRNHASVVMWSIGNEIDYPNDPYTHEILDHGTNPQIYGRGFHADLPHANRLGEIARKLTAIVKEYDETRPVTAGLASALISNETGFADALDVVGYNYQEYRYHDDQKKYPNRVLYGSENGMRWDFWDSVASNSGICGQFLWTGIDYLGEAGKWPWRSNGAGIMDLAGLPKPEYYYRQSLWSDEPMIYIGTRDVPSGEESAGLWSHKAADPVWSGATGAMRRVNCFTNCDQAELLINGRSLGIKDLAGSQERILWWEVPYEAGTLTARGLNGGEVVADWELRTSGAAAKIVAKADMASLRADGIDLAHIEVTIVDAAGVPAYGSSHEITWMIDGPARLLGIESGDHTSHEDYKAIARHAHHGKLLGYIQSTETPGPVTITIRGEGLEEAVVQMQTLP